MKRGRHTSSGSALEAPPGDASPADTTWPELPQSARVLVSVAELLCLYGTLVGSGVLGQRIKFASGGVFSSEATLIAPGVPAFVIWAVVYVGLFIVTLWYWVPSDRTTVRLAPIAGLVAASMLLNAAWILVVQAGLVPLSVLVIAALVVVLGVLNDRLSRSRPSSRVEALVIDGTFGLYLGWVSVAVCANVASALVDAGTAATGTGATVATVAVLALVGALGWVLSRRLPGRIGIPVGVVWGLGWIAYQRSHGTPVSMPVALSAAVVASWVAGSFAQTVTRGLGPQTRQEPLP